MFCSALEYHSLISGVRATSHGLPTQCGGNLLFLAILLASKYKDSWCLTQLLEFDIVVHILRIYKSSSLITIQNLMFMLIKCELSSRVTRVRSQAAMMVRAPQWYWIEAEDLIQSKAFCLNFIIMVVPPFLILIILCKVHSFFYGLGQSSYFQPPMGLCRAHIINHYGLVQSSYSVLFSPDL